MRGLVGLIGLIYINCSCGCCDQIGYLIGAFGLWLLVLGIKQEGRIIDSFLLGLALVLAHQVNILSVLSPHKIQILFTASLSPEELTVHREYLMWNAKYHS